MACARPILHSSRGSELHTILCGEESGFTSACKDIQVWEEAKSKHKKSSREAQKGDDTMHAYKFRFRGGARTLDQCTFKFHVFIADTSATEHHAYGALKNGLLEQSDPAIGEYSSATPVIKLFSATAGFGVAKEFFSYFIMLNPEASKVINIRPLGFQKIESIDWFFSAKGRFMKRDEVKRFFGATSDTWKFYNRQSFLSRHRLSELVHITDGELISKPVKEESSEVRLVRFD